MKTYTVKVASKYAERYLSLEDINSINSMIGSEVQQSDIKSDVDGGILIEMTDGEETHIDFLDLEEKLPEFNF